MTTNMTHAETTAMLRLTERKLLRLRKAAERYLQQDARYDDLTDKCAGAKLALAHAIREAR